MGRVSQEPALLDAALACFAERGYDATRVKHIADRAGLAESALYRHYPSKDALAQALFARGLHWYTDRLRHVAESPGAPLDRLGAIVRGVLDAYREQPDAVIFVLIGTSSFVPRLEPGTRYPIEVVERVVAEGQADGTVRDGPTNLIAAILLGCVLRPIIVATYASPGALDLLRSTDHDHTIEAAAIAAIRRP